MASVSNDTSILFTIILITSSLLLVQFLFPPFTDLIGFNPAIFGTSLVALAAAVVIGESIPIFGGILSGIATISFVFANVLISSNYIISTIIVTPITVLTAFMVARLVRGTG